MLRTRRLLAVLATAAIATVATLTATTAPAHAAASGFLLIKGSGSVYTANDIVNLGVTPGTSKTWGIKVVNTGPTSQQFKITVSPSSSSITPTPTAPAHSTPTWSRGSDGASIGPEGRQEP